MDLQKINVKFFLEKGSDLPLATFIPIFHKWIQDDLLEGMLVDVTEYTHVKDGPGVLIIANEANYGLDETDGKRGFLYNQKRVPEKDSQEHLKTSFKRALKACDLLEKEPATAGKIKFAPQHLQIFINDRAAAPHHSQSHSELEEALNPFLNWLYEGSKYLLIPEKDPQKRVGFEVKVEKSPDLATLLKQLGAN
jgi:hypothetical protein